MTSKSPTFAQIDTHQPNSEITRAHKTGMFKLGVPARHGERRRSGPLPFREPSRDTTERKTARPNPSAVPGRSVLRTSLGFTERRVPIHDPLTLQKALVLDADSDSRAALLRTFDPGRRVGI